MIGAAAATYAAFALLAGAALVVGQAVFVLCGERRWTPLAPAVGLALLAAAAWWAVRLPGEGTAAAVALAILTVGAAMIAIRSEGGGEAIRSWGPLALAGLLLASLPFLAEARFGILGTGLNPDMSQHLFAADRLASGSSERLIAEGYPVGPHALVVSLRVLGPSAVQGFAGLQLAIAVAACLAALPTLRRLGAGRRTVAALLVAFAYASASYLVQGSFKETFEALVLLAFAVALGEVAGGRLCRPQRDAGAWSQRLRAVPLAVLAAGAAYAYSFPGLLWPLGALGLWAAVELALLGRHGGARGVRRCLGAALPVAATAAAAGIVLIAPELGRMVEFARFETFDPEGAGLGNLFDPISPAEALGIWPSGDFRLDPGEGAVPAAIYWLGSILGSVALAFGLSWWWRRGERAVPCALVAAGALYLYALAAGTPYQEAKAIALAAPSAMLVSIRALLEAAPTRAQALRIIRRRNIAELFPRSARLARARLLVGFLALAFVAAAGASTLLALANGPVGPREYSPALAERRPLPGSTLVIVPPDRLADQHLRDFYVWELRGGRVCVAASGAGDEPAPAGIDRVVVVEGSPERPPFADAGSPQALDGDHLLWRVASATGGGRGCPFIPDGARAAPAGA